MKTLFLLLLTIMLLVACQPATSLPPPKRQLLFTAIVKEKWDLYTVDFAAPNPEKSIKRLTESPGKNFNAHWSPDGKQIVFTSTRDGKGEIYVMDADGKNPHNLTNNEADDGSPSWSPDGKQIAFESNRSGGWEVYVMNTNDGSDVHSLSKVDKISERAPAWSPDGKQIAYTTYTGNSEFDGLYIMDANGDNPHRLTGGDRVDRLAWSPDGTTIAFMDSRFENNTENDDIFTFEIASSTLHRLTNDAYVDTSPVWTTDSKQITFVTLFGGVNIMNADGSNRSGLFAINDVQELSIEWKPDPSRLTSNG